MVDKHPFLRISGVVYVALATNLLLVLTSLPVLVLATLVRPGDAVIPLALAIIAAVPGLPAAFEVFRRNSDEGSLSVARTYFAAWWRHLRASLLVGSVVVTILGVLVVDVAWALGSSIGALLIPVLVAAIVATVAVGLGVLVGRLDRPDTRLPALAKASVYLMVRRWCLTIASIAGLLFWGTVVRALPALGLGIVTAPLLYLVWANTRHSLSPILREA